MNSIDYLLKPVGADALYAALDRFRESRFRESGPDGPTPAPGPTPAQRLTPEVIAQVVAAVQGRPVYRERLLSRVGAKLIPLAVSGVAFFESVDRITWTYAPDGTRHPASETLEEL